MQKENLKSPIWSEAVESLLKTCEKLLIGLWATSGIVSASLLASALPYIFAAEPEIRCGSIGISFYAISIIKEDLKVVLLFYTLMTFSRFIYSVARHGIRGLPNPTDSMPLWRRIITKFRIEILKLVSFTSALIWFSAAVSGVIVFMWYLDSGLYIVSNPPILPANFKTDVSGCRGLIVDMKLPNYLAEWAEWMSKK